MPPDLTPWQHGRLDGKAGPKRILFGRTYEDPQVELDAFRLGEVSLAGASEDGASEDEAPRDGVSPTKVLCIASAGCTPHALAQHFDVVAVDINPVQLAYAQGRIAAAPPERGTAERVMAILRGFLPLAGIRRSALDDFLNLEHPRQQAEEWKRLCTWRFRTSLELLFSLMSLRAVYSKAILDPLPAHFGRVLLSRFERGFARHPNRTNPYARALFLGHLPEVLTPAPHPIEFVCSDVTEYLERVPPKTFSGISLSNVLDGASPSYRERLAAAVRRASTPGARVVWRSFAQPKTEKQANLAAQDRSLLWGTVDVQDAQTFE